MLESLFGGLLGGLFRLAPEVLKLLDRKSERAQETAKAQQVFQDYKTSVSKLWLGEAGLLDQEFDDRRKTFLDEVEDRARAQLKI